jgi:TPR repeat protein
LNIFNENDYNESSVFNRAFFLEVSLRKITTIALSLLYSFPTHAADCQTAFLEQDYVTAFSACKEASDSADAQASFIMATIYAKGLSVAPNVDQSISYLTYAAELKHPEAMFNLAVAFELGRGVNKSASDAVGWYQKAAEADFLPAQRKLALMYEKGKGTPVDAKQSYFWYKKAAEAGQSYAQLKLGAILLQDKVVPKDIEAGLSWIEKAALQNETEAQFALATLLWNRDIDKSLYWYEKAAENGNSFAMHNLASIYLKGEKVPLDLDKSERYAKQSIASGQTASERILVAINQLRHPSQELASVEGSEPETLITEPVAVVKAPIEPLTQAEPEVENLVLNAAVEDEIPRLKGYFIQFAKIHSSEGVAHFVRKYKLQGQSQVVELKNEQAYLVLSLAFEDKAAAKAALTELDKALAAQKPWLRSDKSLNALLF